MHHFPLGDRSNDRAIRKHPKFCLVVFSFLKGTYFINIDSSCTYPTYELIKKFKKNHTSLSILLICLSPPNNPSRFSPCPSRTPPLLRRPRRPRLPGSGARLPLHPRPPAGRSRRSAPPWPGFTRCLPSESPGGPRRVGTETSLLEGFADASYSDDVLLSRS
jgi:hypothetical protein